MWKDIDSYLSPKAHQIIGACAGIIFCAWFVGATSEQVFLIRLPSTLILSAYLVAWTGGIIHQFLWPGR